MVEFSKLWQPASRTMRESSLLRYGVAILLSVAAAIATLSRPALEESPYFVFLGSVVLSALYGGLGPAFMTTAASLLLIRLLFIVPQFALYLDGHAERMERVGVFAIIALMLACLVSALRRERNALRASEERYRILVESASHGILVFDQQQQVIFANPVIEKIFGAPARSILGCQLSRLLPESQYSRQLADVAYRMDTRIKPEPLRVQGQDFNGHQLLLELSFGAFTKHGRNLFTAIVRAV